MHLRRRPGPARPRLLGAVAALALAASLTGCSGEEPTTNADPGHDTAGHEMTMDDVADQVTPPPGADWNATDAAYLTMMLSHHRQAVEMSQLATTRASDPGVRAIAEAIGRGQGGEILVMAGWLEQHDLPVPSLEDAQGMADMAGSGGGMQGMLSPDQMSDLEDADGTAFDELFLSGMVQHHQGAVEMATVEVGEGQDVRVVEMATDVIAGQTAEINRMRALQEG